jgi:hypothetical protein
VSLEFHRLFLEHSIAAIPLRTVRGVERAWIDGHEAMVRRCG